MQLLNRELWSPASSTHGSEFPGCVNLGKLTNLCLGFLINTIEVIIDLPHGVVVRI